MKKLLSIVVLAGLSLASCKKDDDNSANKLVGTWDIVKTETYENNVLVSTDEESAGTMTFSGCGFNTFCNADMFIAALEFTWPLKYKINESYTQLVFDVDGDLSTTEDLTTNEVTMTNDTNLSYTSTSEENGVTTKEVTILRKR